MYFLNDHAGRSVTNVARCHKIIAKSSIFQGWVFSKEKKVSKMRDMKMGSWVKAQKGIIGTVSEWGIRGQ